MNAPARKYVGIKFTIGYTVATGVVMYLINMVKCLKKLPDASQPHLVIFYTQQTPLADIQAVDYPYVDYVPLENEATVQKPSLGVRILNKLSRIIRKKDWVEVPYRYEPYVGALDAIYEVYAPNPLFYTPAKRYICWIADFQQRYFPDYFSIDEYKSLEKAILEIASPAYELALSSQDCKDDFLKFYEKPGAPIHLMRFVSLLPDVSHIKGEEVKKKYNLTKRYFIISNQFWPHKNHFLVLKSIALFRQQTQQSDIEFVFTGHLSSHRQPAYIEQLKAYIQTHQLEPVTHFLGLIPREDQLVLIKNSLAVVQPSLFEGWSTIVEDCKALNHPIILSDIRVHREQMTYSSFDNHLFFDGADAEGLTRHMETVATHGFARQPFDYTKDIDAYVHSLKSLFDL